MIRNIIEYLRKSANTYPDKIAFSDDNDNITFLELDKKARAIATLIQATIGDGVRNHPIAIYLPKGVDCLVCFLGIAYSGNFYTPLDTKSPQNRIVNILSVLKPELIITDDKYSDEVKNYGKTLSLNKAYATSPLINDSDYGYKSITDIDPLYVLFTSGSTGVPKGVVISHRGVIDYTEWLHDTFRFDTNTIFGNQAPFYFDNSILDIYSTLKNASTLYIIPERLFMTPIKLLEYINEKEINTIFWVPSALSGVANSGALDKVVLKGIEKILFCGEVMPTKQLNVWRHHYPNVLFANLYGPTEITDVCTYHIISRDYSDSEPLPIGKACENMEILVLNDDNKLVTGGERGELCVKGSGVSMGYYNSSEKTAGVFIQNPLNKAYREIIYRTGDVVHYNEFGELMYDCRKDYQIKHQGHRIELGEIDAAGSSIDGIDTCCTLYDNENKRIVFFYVSACNTSEKEVYSGLKNMIPRYMLPSIINKIETMPLNLNGKIDRVALQGIIGE